MSDSNSNNAPIQVAIIGGSIAAAVLLRGLLKYPNISADLYEARPTFSEESSGINLSPAAQGIIRNINPELITQLEAAGAVYNVTEFRMAAGPEAGRSIPVDRGDPPKMMVGRQSLLTALLAGVPSQTLHRNTRVASVKEMTPSEDDDGPPLVLTFADGTQRRFDVVVGADSVHGLTRSYVLGGDAHTDPALSPRPSGVWGLAVRVPLERAQRMMGSEFLDPRWPRQVGWIGNGIYMQHNLVNGARDVQIVVYAQHHGAEDDFAWAKLFTPEEFGDMFSSLPGAACQGMVKLIQSVYTIQVAGICHMRHAPLSTYAANNACIIGDAAHALAPHQIHTANIIIEEAFILSEVLGRAATIIAGQMAPVKACAIASALGAFDRVCRPRAERVQQWSFDIGQIITGMAPDAGLDADLVAENLTRRWRYLQDLDLGTSRVSALQAMDEFMAEK